MTEPRASVVRRRWCSTSAAVALAMVALVACGGDDDQSETPAPSSTTGRAPATTEATQPPGTSPVDVEPYIAELLVRFDDVTNQIVADPSVANDREHPLVAEYLSLVEPGSLAEGAVQGWVDAAGQGISIRPYDDSAPSHVTALDGDVETVSADEVTFPTCERHHYRMYDAQGRETEFVTGQSIPGAGTAVRVDGEWRLRRIDIAEDTLGCRREAA